MIIRKILEVPCEVGFVCPYWGHDEDGQGICKCPDIAEKKGRRWYYTYLSNLEMCPLVNVDTPIDKWLKSLEQENNNA